MFPGNCRCTFCCPAVVVGSDDEILNCELFSEIVGHIDSGDSLDDSVAHTVAINPVIARPAGFVQLLVKLVLLLFGCFVMCG